MTGIYHADSIRDVAESLGISALPEGVASMLASDVEYRLHQIIDEASRFSRHSNRTTLTTTDIDQAFKILNIEPVYGHSGLTAPLFKRAVPTVGPPVYALQDEEIDFEKIVREEEIPVPRAVNWSAHWLAIEGVQPLVPENPSPAPPSSSSTAPAKPRPGQPQSNGTTRTPQAPPTFSTPSVAKPQLTTKSHLSRELQQYYARLTESLLPGEMVQEVSGAVDRQTERKRAAALSSLRSDAGLQGILPYLVKWVGDTVVNALAVRSSSGLDDGLDVEDDVDRKTLEVMLSVINAILDNKRLFVEPYLHMLLPPLLSIVLTSTLSSTASYSSMPSHPPPTPRTLRTHAASLISHLLEIHAPSYPSLPPRITKTLLVALLEDASPLPNQPAALSPKPNGSLHRNSTPPESGRKAMALGSKDGAIRGLVGVGKEAVYRGLIGGKVGKQLGEEVQTRIRGGSAGVSGRDDMMVDLDGFGSFGGNLAPDDGWIEEVRDLVDAFMVGLATIHPLPPSAVGDNGYPSFAHSAYVDPAQLQQAKAHLASVIGPFFADRVSRKSGEWAVGLATTLLEKELSLSSQDAGALEAHGINPLRIGGDDDLPLEMAIGGPEISMMNDDGSPGEAFGAATGLLPVHSEMGLPLGMGGDLGGPGSDAMDAT
ncbi:hypothetical protein FRB94_013618 [Tulasnella sp. JGI-2019a]|nr:hypothetical protein FRB93_007636 [Tulasnella sp. JGI-2019a]KAG9008258.1 hypothetical protein FRB94_013618 [Tulasnella sp. JGI-2019a]